ncbi:MAG: LysR substrate-binding domain-containing protein [Pseudomonadota bacterium]
MRYTQLRAFHHVATAGGFSSAAQALNLTQPAISDQVRSLEDDYDIKLFDRTKRRVQLTAQGADLLTVTRRLFEAERQAAELLSEQRALRAGRLRIVADSAHHILHVLAQFRARYPGVQITVTSGNSDTVPRQLHDYEADIGVMGEVPKVSEFRYLVLGASPIIAFAPRDSAFAKAQSLTLMDLAAVPLVLREDGSKTRRKFLEAARAAEVDLAPIVEAEGREAVREIVAAGGGVGIVSRAEFGHDARLAPIQIADAPGLEMEEALVCLSHRREVKLIAAFFDMALSFVEDGPRPKTAEKVADGPVGPRIRPLD